MTMENNRDKRSKHGRKLKSIKMLNLLRTIDRQINPNWVDPHLLDGE